MKKMIFLLKLRNGSRITVESDHGVIVISDQLKELYGKTVSHLLNAAVQKKLGIEVISMEGR